MSEKSEAQIRNEEEVHKIMKERGYDDFWGVKNDDRKPRDKVRIKKIIVGLTCIAMPIILVGSVFVNMYINNQKEQTRENLSECLKSALQTYENAIGAGVEGIEPYSSQIECHEKYKTDTYERDMASLTESKTSAELLMCLNQADENYAVSDEEIASAGNDVNAGLILVKRIGSRIDAKMSCHNKYKTNLYETEMNKLKADKAENKAYIEDAENAIKYQQNQSKSYTSTSTHCYSNSIGSSIYTNCY